MSKNIVFNKFWVFKLSKATPSPRPRQAQARMGIIDLSWQILSILRIFWFQNILDPALQAI